MNIQRLKLLLVATTTLIVMYSCQNAPIEFDDYGVTITYFPYQTPVRTIILGKYDEGFNENDNLRQFEIGVVMTGVYSNKSERKVHFELDTTLMTPIANVKYLPSTHYTIETPSPVVIPVGSTKGRILVKLTDAFFNDPKCVSGFYGNGTPVVNYAIPIKIKSVENLDSVLKGKSLVVNPVSVRSTDWSVQPRDYTLFSVKYINKFHANYLRRGADKLYNSAVDTLYGVKYYRAQYVEKNEIAKASTVDLNSVTVPSIIRRYNRPDGGTLSLKLQFTGDSCVVSNDVTKVAIGKGKLVENGDSWGGKSRDVIYLQYSYVDVPRIEKHIVNDTMVVRDRGIGFETFTFTLKP